MSTITIIVSLVHVQMRSLMLEALLIFPSLGDNKSIVHAQSWIDMELCEPPTLHFEPDIFHRIDTASSESIAPTSFSPFDFASKADGGRSDRSTSNTGSRPNNDSGSTSGNDSSRSSGNGSSRQASAAGTIKHVGHSISAADAMRAIDEMMGERARCARDSNQRYVLSC